MTEEYEDLTIEELQQQFLNQLLKWGFSTHEPKFAGNGFSSHGRVKEPSRARWQHLIPQLVARDLHAWPPGVSFEVYEQHMVLGGRYGRMWLVVCKGLTQYTIQQTVDVLRSIELPRVESAEVVLRAPHETGDLLMRHGELAGKPIEITQVRG